MLSLGWILFLKFTLLHYSWIVKHDSKQLFYVKKNNFYLFILRFVSLLMEYTCNIFPRIQYKHTSYKFLLLIESIPQITFKYKMRKQQNKKKKYKMGDKRTYMYIIQIKNTMPGIKFLRRIVTETNTVQTMKITYNFIWRNIDKRVISYYLIYGLAVTHSH